MLKSIIKDQSSFNQLFFCRFVPFLGCALWIPALPQFSREYLCYSRCKIFRLKRDLNIIWSAFILHFQWREMFYLHWDFWIIATLCVCSFRPLKLILLSIFWITNLILKLKITSILWVFFPLVEQVATKLDLFIVRDIYILRIFWKLCY